MTYGNCCATQSVPDSIDGIPRYENGGSFDQNIRTRNETVRWRRGVRGEISGIPYIHKR